MTASRTCLLLLLLALPASATTWYVSSSASGAHNGTSWTDAWTNLNQITGLGAGDTVYISGGSSGQTYNQSAIWTPIAGTSGGSVNYLAGQDSGHNGPITFNGNGQAYWVNLSASYININGSGPNGQTNFILTGYNAMASNSVVLSNLHLAYINLGNIANGCNESEVTWGPAIEMDHWYAYCTNTGMDIFWLKDFSGNGYDSNIIHDITLCLPNNSASAGVGPDFWHEGGNGYTISNCTCIGYSTTGSFASQHQDGYQALGGNYVKVINNTFVNCANQSVFPDQNNGFQFSHCRFCNNVCYYNVGGNHWCVSFLVDLSAGSGTNVTDVVIANNFGDNGGSVQGAFGFHDDQSNSGPAANYSNCYIANNIWINCAGLGQVDSGVISSSNTGWTTSQTYGATNFVSYTANALTNNNVHLVANSYPIGRGTNLFSLFTTDKDGNNRPSTGAWDIGPYAYSVSPPAPAAGSGGFSVWIQ